jgi:cytoplasmic iron level regulating protein YaaA (DUF328/UPF0246 family)
MIIILSPAKSLDFASQFEHVKSTIPKFNQESIELVKALQKFDVETLEKLMNISNNLAKLNFSRFQDFSKNPQLQAILAYDGDVYEGFNKKKFSEDDFKYAQEHIRIISGLYGILRPLDLIKPYRLEMSVDFKNVNFLTKNLYQFWHQKIIDYFNDNSQEVIINLASLEYAKVIDHQKIPQKIINITFKEYKNNQLKIIALNAKKARGLMANYAIVNKITDPKKLKNFNQANYNFKPELSNEKEWVFVR